MATKKELINRVASPMRLVEENYDIDRDEMESRKKRMIASQSCRSRIL